MSERTDNIAIITELAVACTIFAPCLEEPPDYPAYIDDETGAKAEADRLSEDNEALEAKVEVTEDLYDALADDIKELQRENDELRTELDKRKRTRKETESDGGETRTSDTSNRKDGRTVDVDARSSDRDTGADRAGVVPLGQTEAMTMEATAYTAHCDTGCTGVTATGIDVTGDIYHEGKRVIAVDPTQIPLGSTVRVKAGGETFEAVAEDTGGNVGHGRIDILVESTEEALRFGRQSATVEIINE